MKKNRNIIFNSKFLVISVLLLVFIFSISMSFAKTNTIYDVDSDGTVDLSIEGQDNVVLRAIGQFVYSLAGYVEKMVSKIFGKVIGTNTFPWADRILFNTIPFLDINYISPSSGSLYLSPDGNSTFIGDIIKRIYYIIFAISISFFGITIAITAIKLVISSIAAQKAKYKQAIQNWIFAIILLFTTHYFISFIFFVNEKLVEVASNLLEANLDEYNVNINLSPIALSNDEAKRAVKTAVKEAFKGWLFTDTFDESIEVEYGIKGGVDRVLHATWEVNKDADLNFKITELPDKDYNTDFYFNIASLTLNTEYMENMSGLYDFEAIWQGVKEDKKSGGAFGYLSAAVGTLKYGVNKIRSFITDDESGKKALKKIMRDAAILTLLGDDVINDYNQSLGDAKISIDSVEQAKLYYLLAYSNNDLAGRGSYSFTEAMSYGGSPTVDPTSINKIIGWTISKFDNNEIPKEKYNGEYINSYLNAVLDVWSNNNAGGAKRDLFTNLGKFFKNLAYGPYYDKNGNIVGYTAAKFRLIPAILYVIFIVQSIMYLISYMKRLFYIVILALFSPLVVLYDFVTKVTA